MSIIPNSLEVIMKHAKIKIDQSSAYVDRMIWYVDPVTFLDSGLECTLKNGDPLIVLSYQFRNGKNYLVCVSSVGLISINKDIIEYVD